MKAALTYLVLIAYLAGLVKPVLPIFLDVIAHTFHELEHTNTIHKHNGENHVHVEITATKKEETNSNTPTHKIEVSANPHLLSKLLFDFSIQPITQNLSSLFRAYDLSAYLFVDYPPPRL